MKSLRDLHDQEQYEAELLDPKRLPKKYWYEKTLAQILIGWFIGSIIAYLIMDLISIFKWLLG